MRVFSAAVLNDSKRFKKDYEKKVVKVLVRSPLYEEGMTDDEILSVHGILSYAQVMEWKGPLLYKLKGGQEYIEDKAREKEYEIDTSQNQYGTVINSQTLERAFPVSIKGVQRIVTIENKANYEEMKYREDTLYLFCHGFYSPKERIFLKRLMEVAEGEIQYFHWGDMDMVVDGADAVAAGNDIVMPGGPPVIRQILKGYEEGRVTREELEQAVRHLLIMIKRIRLAD